MYRIIAGQDEIDREYNPRLGRPDVDRLLAEWGERSTRARERLRGRIGVPYGPTRAENLDLFPARNPGAPIHIFFHGGYWRTFSAADFSFLAEAATARGVTTVVVNYALCPSVSITEIVRQARAALAWTWRYAEDFGGDRDCIIASGHSAGGQLVGQLLATAWERDYGLPDDIIKGACTISGVFDLEPLRWSWLQPVLQLTADEIAAQSPIRHLPAVGAPVVVTVGALESTEFRRQSRDYAAALERVGVPSEFLELDGRDHFTVLDDLADADGPIWQAIEAMTRC